MAPKAKRKSSSKATSTAKRPKAVGRRVIEKGHMYLFYRPKVDVHEVKTLDDVQKLFICLAVNQTNTERVDLQAQAEEKAHGKAASAPPAAAAAAAAGQREASSEQEKKAGTGGGGGGGAASGGGAGTGTGGFAEHLRPASLYRIIIVPKKKLPLVGSPEMREFAFVEHVTNDLHQAHEFLCHKSYVTKTRGERELEAAVRSAAYELIASAEGRSADKETVHLAYALEVPKEPTAVQHLFHVEHEGRFIIQVRNPDLSGAADDRDTAPPELKETPKYPEVLMKAFAGKRKATVKFAAPNPPTFLNYQRTSLLLVGGKADLLKFGEIGRQLEQVAEEHDKQAGASAERIRQEMDLEPKAHPSSTESLH